MREIEKWKSIQKMETGRHWIEDLTFDLKEFKGVKAQPFRWGESCEKSHWRRPATVQWV